MAAWGIFLVMILCLLALCIRGVRIALGIVAIGVLIYDRDVRAITARRANEGTDVGSLLCDVDLPSNTPGAVQGQAFGGSGRALYRGRGE
jgi:hypothetical protein